MAGLALAAFSSFGAPPGARRALLIGINDYSASRLPALRGAAIPNRDWANLDGAVNDVLLMRELLIARYDFAPADIVMLTDQQATRAAIERAIQVHLLQPAKKDDVLLFYYSGHGSQVRNSKSSETDKLDESLVPADSRSGARDIHDKELSAAFNRILDRGARLTVVLDACHSASGARGLSGGLRHRGIKPDLRDVADASDQPRLEERGALILAATEDFDLAYETLDPDGPIRGAFSWAFARSLRDADPGESVSDTFLRAQARLRAEMPAQTPVLAGRADMRAMPFLGKTGEWRSARPAIAIESISNSEVRLLGGWAHGLTVGTRLRPAGDANTELEVTELIGAGRAEARIVRSVRAADPVRAGDLLEMDAWAAPAARKLRVWMPSAPESAIAKAKKLQGDAVASGIRSIDDPTEVTPTCVSRWQGDAWKDVIAGEAACSKTLFVQVPAPVALAQAIGAAAGVQFVDGPEKAEYILTGRVAGNGVEYAWVRPQIIAADAQRSAMPVRTAWTSLRAIETTAVELRRALLGLVRVHGWQELPSPAGGGSHYRLAVRNAADQTLVERGPLIGKREYHLVLRLREPRPATLLYARYVYAFVIDSHGRSVLLFPRPESGSVENRVPLTQTAGLPIDHPPAEIPLGTRATFAAAPPYGQDTFFLLSTDTPLPSTACLEWNGVRAASDGPRTALENLLTQFASHTRGDPLPPTPPSWSIEKIVLESVPPKGGSR